MKLTIKQAVDIVEWSRRNTEGGKLRLGQVLFNALPESTSNLVYLTPNDFFYWLDEEKVLATFYNECVEK